MADQENDSHLFAKRHAYDRKARGEIIYAAIVIESIIEGIIADHCAKDKFLFGALIFGEGQITFSQKLIMLKKLFKEYYPDLIFPKMFKRLDELRQLRNKLAHSKVGHSIPADMPWEKESIDTLPEGTVLEYFKIGYAVHEDLPKEAVDKTLNQAGAYEQLLTLIEMEVQDRISGETDSGRFDDLKKSNPELFAN